MWMGNSMSCLQKKPTPYMQLLVSMALPDFKHLMNVFSIFCIVATIATTWTALSFMRRRLHSSFNDGEDPGDNRAWGPHKLAIIVPFRNCYNELVEFAPHIHTYLMNKKVRHKIYVINQVDDFRFNRASLINIGFLLSQNESDYIAMHDVDLLPLNVKLNYGYPDKGPFHVSAPGLHPMFTYARFIGGILLVNNKHFKLVNGMTTKFWGHGREDDEFYLRLEKAGLKIHRPENITTARSTFRNIHNMKRRPKDIKRYFNQSKDMLRLDQETGLTSLQYYLESKQRLTVDGAPFIIYNVRLKCNYEKTPWCLTPDDYKVVKDAKNPNGRLVPKNPKIFEDAKNIKLVPRKTR